MYKIKITFFAMATLLFLESCCLISKSPEVLIKTEFNGNGIAVMNFTKQNSSTTSDLGKIAADKLTDALFLEGKYNVIDRAVVNEALISMNIKTTELLSREDIKRFGNSINANFLIAGRIQTFTKQEFLNDDEEKELYVSFRLISVETGDVIGIGTYKNTFTENIMDGIKTAVSTLVKKMM